MELCAMKYALCIVFPYVYASQTFSDIHCISGSGELGYQTNISLSNQLVPVNLG